jgi:hypothetical protein
MSTLILQSLNGLVMTALIGIFLADFAFLLVG